MGLSTAGNLATVEVLSRSLKTGHPSREFHMRRMNEAYDLYKCKPQQLTQVTGPGN